MVNLLRFTYDASHPQATAAGPVGTQGQDRGQVLLSFHDLVGHTPIYCLELCEYFLSRGFAVTVATNLSRPRSLCFLGSMEL